MKTLLLILVLSLSAMAQTATVITQNAVLRERTSVTGKILSKARYNTKYKLESQEHTNGWYLVSLSKGKIKGWINGNDIEIQSGVNDKPLNYSKIYKDEWLEYTITETAVYYYNPSKLIREGFTMKTWVKEKNSVNLKTQGVAQYQVDCKNLKVRTLALVSYNEDGSIFNSFDTPNSKYSTIIPDSVGDRLAKTVCNPVKPPRPHLTVQGDSIAPPLTIQGDSDVPPPPPIPETVSGGILNFKAISLPQPAYPPAAKAVRAGGTVSVAVKINKNGDVISAKAISGHPLLQSAAEEAARKAKFNQTQLSGKPVSVTGVITYNFIL